MRRYVTYIRVSTKEQGGSGLGLEAQERDIQVFLDNYSDIPWEIVAKFQDIGSGADNGRPMLQRAITVARRSGAELLVAKLDRLSRKVSHLAALMEDPKLKLRVASMPHADKFQLHIYAALAEQERDFISARTKAALAAAKARGVKLGGFREGSGLQRATAVRIAKAAGHAAQVNTIIAPMRAAGLSLQAIAGKLNGSGVRAPAGGSWTKMAVKRVLERVGA